MFGTFPLSVSDLIYNYSTVSFAKNWCVLSSISATLALIELFLVHRMQGSLGSVVCGLRVQNLNGSAPDFWKTCIRASPYLISLATILARQTESISALFGAMGLDLSLIFIVTSGVVTLFGSKHSLIERLTGTELVKAYRRPLGQRDI